MYQTYNSSRPLSSHRTPMVLAHYTTYTIVIKQTLQYKELSLIRQFLLSLKKQPDSLNTVLIKAWSSGGLVADFFSAASHFFQ